MNDESRYGLADAHQKPTQLRDDTYRTVKQMFGDLIGESLLIRVLDESGPSYKLADVIPVLWSVLEEEETEESGSSAGETCSEEQESTFEQAAAVTTESFTVNGNLQIDGAVDERVALDLATYIDACLSAHVRGQKIAKERQTIRAKTYAEVRRMLSDDMVSDTLLKQALDAHSPNYKFSEVMSTIYSLMEEEEDEGWEHEEKSTNFEGADAFDESTLRSYGTSRHLLKLQLLDEPVIAALRQLLPRIEPVLSSALGLDCVLVECSALIVDPGSPSQSLHADTVWSHDPETVAIFLAVQDISEEMGPTLMLPGTHSSPSFWQTAIKTSDPVQIVSDSQYRHEKLGPIDLKVCSISGGTAMVMDTRLLHCGGSNRSARRRTLFYLTFTKKSSGYEDISSNMALIKGTDLDAEPDLRRIANTNSYRRMAHSLYEEYGSLVTLQGLVDRFV